eukprot:TRINITY_DN68325_c0_g1_i1.p1 TRINITY_DN68325_c0_g1~~TRINITY_DN68325_c0_g1_i1.p1  ORF type:complete len:269 (-),score=53.36 TRINITY_DN68325_c0_g1_i1:15-821(-)
MAAAVTSARSDSSQTSEPTEEGGHWVQEPEIEQWVSHSSAGRGYTRYTELELQQLINSDVEPCFSLMTVPEMEPSKAKFLVSREIEHSFPDALAHVREGQMVWPKDPFWSRSEFEIISDLRENPPQAVNSTPGQKTEKKAFWTKHSLPKLKREKEKQKDSEVPEAQQRAEVSPGDDGSAEIAAPVGGLETSVDSLAAEQPENVEGKDGDEKKRPLAARLLGSVTPRFGAKDKKERDKPEKEKTNSPFSGLRRKKKPEDSASQEADGGG